MSTLLNVATAGFTLVALTLVILGVTAWRRSRRTKTALLAVGFGWFLAAGLMASWWIFTREDLGNLLAVHIVLTGLGLLTIYFATVKR